MIKISEAEFHLFARLIGESTGIVLDSSKASLVETRLAPLIAKAGVQSYAELYRLVGEAGSEALRMELIDRITTQETSFFRDAAPFEMLKYKIIPDLVDARAASCRLSGARMPLRIWSAACATGQELYSIAMALEETLGDLSRYDLRLMGTDISDAAIAKASLGRYPAAEVSRGMSDERLARHFSRDGEGVFRVRDELRVFASFKRLNLQEDFSRLGTWDIVFCRNLAIYFSDEAKKNLFTRMASALAPDGCLVLGSTESLIGICPQYEAKRYVRSTYYRLR